MSIQSPSPQARFTAALAQNLQGPRTATPQQALQKALDVGRALGLSPAELARLTDAFGASQTLDPAAREALAGFARDGGKPAAATLQRGALWAVKGNVAVPSSGSKTLPPALTITTQEKQAYALANAPLVAKYPAFAKLFGDPAGFVKDMQSRFETQKKLTPDTPYRFDFSDVGIPEMEGFSKALDQELVKVKQELTTLEDSFRPLRFLHDRSIIEHQKGLELLTALKKDVDGHVKSGKVDYQRTIELGFFVAGALGHFDQRDIPVMDRVLLAADRHLQGHVETTIDQKMEQYKNNTFSVFQANTPVRGFAQAEKPFQDAFFNKDKLEMVVLPTTHDLDIAPFMRLMPYNIFFAGVAQAPIKADGFNRPGADFWLHDIRHSSAIYAKRAAYEEEHQLAPPQVEKLQKLTDVWTGQLSAEVSKLPDENLKNAINFFMFNFHHDRGYPILPSSYEPTSNVDSHVPKLLYTMLKVSQQSVDFNKPSETLTQAYDFLRNFFQARAGEEKAVLNAKAA